jgi:hypothetical protein
MIDLGAKLSLGRVEKILQPPLLYAEVPIVFRVASLP